jgi:hypothetical protein
MMITLQTGPKGLQGGPQSSSGLLLGRWVSHVVRITKGFERVEKRQ